MIRFDWLAAPRVDESRDAAGGGVLGARLEYLAEGSGGDGVAFEASPLAALSRLRDACVEASRPRRVVGCGGDDPALVRALAELAEERGDTLVLAPPVASGAAAAESLWLATETGPDLPPPLLVIGAATQTGFLGPLADVLDLVEDRGLEVVVDLGAAPYAVLDELDAFRPLGFVAPLDRWDGGAPGAWAALPVPEGPLDAEPGLPPEAPCGLPRQLVEIDAWLRGVLQSRGAFRPWPRLGAGISPGVVTFEIEGHGAAEARLMLERSFGVLVDAGPLSAAPLPPSAGLQGEPLRIALHPDHDERDVEPLVRGLLRLAESPVLAPTLH